MKASEMEKGQTIIIDGSLYVIIDYQHVKPGKGGAVYQTKLKSLADGSVKNVRFRSEETVQDVLLDKRTFEYLYSAGNAHILMDIQSYDQVTLGSDVFGEGHKYLKPNTQLQVSMYKGRPVTVTLPNTVELKVTDTQPEIKGATAANQSKPAALETGLVISVPSFIKVGDIVSVDTRTGEYLTRVK